MFICDFAHKLGFAVWDIFSHMNGNPELQASSTRFCIALFFLFLLYTTIRMRAMASYKPHQMVALIGCVLMMIREFTMLVTMGGWELGLVTDPYVHFLWPPVEHFFSTMAYLCFAWYTIEASQWNPIRRLARNLAFPFMSGIAFFSVYALVTWKQFFIAHFPNILFAYKDSSVDWQTHLILTVIAVFGLVAAYKRRRGNTYLLWFWLLVCLEHSFRTYIFAFCQEQSWQATIFHAMHIWSIPLLLLHFVNAYVLKMGNCAICKRDVASF